MGYSEQGEEKLSPEVSDEKPSIETTIEALKISDLSVPSRILTYGLSHLKSSEIADLGDVWRSISEESLSTLLKELAEFSEVNFDVDYRVLGTWALADAEAKVRAAAIELLWEDETPHLMEKLIEIAQWDESHVVRATAVSALGRFISLGEFGKLSAGDLYRLQDLMITILSNSEEDDDVRRRALESIANSSHEIVPDAIQESYASPNPKMKASAIFAMGKSNDSIWQDTVLRELNSIEPELRYEAARAAGELDLNEAVPALTRLAFGDEYEIKEIAIWALGEIGGREAVRVLSAIAQEAEEVGNKILLEAIEDAIGNASLIGGDITTFVGDEDLL